MIILSPIGQSNNGAALGAGSDLSLANQYLRFAQDGAIYYGRDENGNQITSTESANVSRYTFQQAGGGGNRYGYEGACHDRLISRGITEPVLFVPQWAGGTNTLEWVANVALSPDTDLVSDPIPIFRHRLRYALKMTDAKQGAIIIYQGESNATGTVGAGPDEWGTHWGTICDNLISFVDNYGGTWFHPTLKFIIVQLFETNPNVGTYPDWDAVRAAQSNFVLGRTDCKLVTAPNGPFNEGLGENVHLEYGTTADNGQRGLGKLIADVLVDDFEIA